MFVRKTNLYQDSILGNASNVVSGELNTIRSDISEYFGLKQENERLAEENTFYLSKVKYPNVYPKDTTLPSESDSVEFTYSVAKVIDNNVTQSVNYIMINKGSNDSIEKGQGVITGLGVVGIITNTSQDYALARSVVSTKSRISVKHKKSGAFGNLTWDGNSPWRLSIDNVSKTNIVAVGDTFVTAGYSNFFPPNIPAAIVSEVKQDPSTSFLYIDVKLSIDIDKLDYVYIVKNKDKPQIDSLRNTLPIISE